MEHSLNPFLHVVNPKVYEGRFSPDTCGIGISDHPPGFNTKEQFWLKNGVGIYHFILWAHISRHMCIWSNPIWQGWDEVKFQLVVPCQLVIEGVAQNIHLFLVLDSLPFYDNVKLFWAAGRFVLVLYGGYYFLWWGLELKIYFVHFPFSICSILILIFLNLHFGANFFWFSKKIFYSPDFLDFWRVFFVGGPLWFSIQKKLSLF